MITEKPSINEYASFTMTFSKISSLNKVGEGIVYISLIESAKINTHVEFCQLSSLKHLDLRYCPDWEFNPAPED
jgi:hypothetical protein